MEKRPGPSTTLPTQLTPSAPETATQARAPAAARPELVPAQSSSRAIDASARPSGSVPHARHSLTSNMPSQALGGQLPGKPLLLNDTLGVAHK